MRVRNKQIKFYTKKTKDLETKQLSREEECGSWLNIKLNVLSHGLDFLEPKELQGLCPLITGPLWMQVKTSQLFECGVLEAHHFGANKSIVSIKG